MHSSSDYSYSRFIYTCHSITIHHGLFLLLSETMTSIVFISSSTRGISAPNLHLTFSTGRDGPSVAASFVRDGFYCVVSVLGNGVFVCLFVRLCITAGRPPRLWRVFRIVPVLASSPASCGACGTCTSRPWQRNSDRAGCVEPTGVPRSGTRR